MFVFFLLTRPRPSGSWRTDETKKNVSLWRVGHLYSRRRENAHPSINNIQVKTKVATSIAHHFFPLTNWQLLIIGCVCKQNTHKDMCVLFVSSFSRVEFTWENGSRETVTFFHVGRSIRVESSRWWKFVFFLLSRDDSLTDGVHNSKNSMITNFARGVFFSVRFIQFAQWISHTLTHDRSFCVVSVDERCTSATFGHPLLLMMRGQPWPVWKGKEEEEEEEEEMYLKKKITHSGEIYGPEKHSTHFFWCPSLFLFFYLYLFTFLPSSSCVVTLPCWCHVTNGLSWRKVKHEDKRRRRRLFLQPAQSFARTCTSAPDIEPFRPQ
jgi:hypothetical protein